METCSVDFVGLKFTLFLFSQVLRLQTGACTPGFPNLPFKSSFSFYQTVTVLINSLLCFLFLCVSICGTWVYKHLCGCACLYMPLWRAEVGVQCLLLILYFVFMTGSLTEPEVTILTRLCPHFSPFLGLQKHSTCLFFYICAELLLAACTGNTLLCYPPPHHWLAFLVMMPKGFNMQ